MSPMTLNPALIPTGARKLVRALVLLSLAAAPAAAASPIWTQQQELTAFDGTAGDYFGGCISVSGDTAVIGAPGKNGFQGAAYVFVQSGGVWRSEEHTSELQSLRHLVCRLLLENKITRLRNLLSTTRDNLPQAHNASR